ncbi:RNA-binding S4 domain-containing protein [Flavobacteriaceae bacterium]|nr:RNA-binding S4 domain-containing protein [Flavobacteriaceae bacterium]MDB4203687.1 RNA-binding S4 domain-containing protein [Flavobacteriaceae bacterium]MDB9796521.1 RNA-binding S4 domain-containing protein [Flavobacteriaceae bacterium]MDB9858872.1 RNA-binding S4 domain-containing protein [Flavobacteriaceae bacterium]
MRVDKYLWSVRYYKTRSIATQACKKGAVRINDAAVKPSRDVYPGDNVTLRKNQINYSLKVIEVPKSRVGPKLVDLYRVDTTPKEAFQQQELLKYSKEYYRKRGMGRPTKKDRRDIEDYIKEEE